MRSLLQVQVDHPTVTVQHATAVQTWNFSDSTDFSLATEVLPFTVTPLNAVSLEAVERLNEDCEHIVEYSTVMEGNAVLSAASNAKAMWGTNCYIPVDMDEAKDMLGAYGDLLGAILGTKHPNVVEHFRSQHAYQEVIHLLKQHLNKKLGPRLAAATLVYY